MKAVQFRIAMLTNYLEKVVKLYQEGFGLNPSWKGKSETYEDPDQWRIILFNGVFNP